MMTQSTAMPSRRRLDVLSSRALAQSAPAMAQQLPFIVFGGANLDGDMGKEVVRTFPVIDYGVSGEADTAFPALHRVLSPMVAAGSAALRA